MKHFEVIIPEKNLFKFNIFSIFYNTNKVSGKSIIEEKISKMTNDSVCKNTKTTTVI